MRIFIRQQNPSKVFDIGLSFDVHFLHAKTTLVGLARSSDAVHPCADRFLKIDRHKLDTFFVFNQNDHIHGLFHRLCSGI